MSDLQVDEGDIDATCARLDAAALPILDSCPATDVVGSPTVAGALAEVESLLRTVFGALAGSSTSTSAAVRAIGTELDAADATLAEGAP